MTAFIVQCRDGYARIIHAETQEQACAKMAASPRRLEHSGQMVSADASDAWAPTPEALPEVTLVFELDWEALLRLRAAGVVELRDA